MKHASLQIVPWYLPKQIAVKSVCVDIEPDDTVLLVCKRSAEDFQVRAISRRGAIRNLVGEFGCWEELGVVRANERRRFTELIRELSVSLQKRT